jgi:putative FmdB family regulatory protein
MSKFMYFDFRCLTCEHTFEDFVKPDVNPPCPECEGASKRIASAVRINCGDGKDPDFPSSYDKWQKTNKQKTAIDKKFYADHGVDKKHHSYGS